ncbi:MAG: MgtC/SapB family protein [Pedobacter sp.]
MDLQIWQQFGIALGLGLLVGLQREWAEPEAAGIRTFALITVLGTACAHLAARFGGLVLAGGLVALGGLMVVSNLRRDRSKEAHPGPTTEMAALVMFAVGALLQGGMIAEAAAIGGGVALLLHWKKPLHHFVKRIGDSDIQAVFRMVLIALVVLPLLPDRSFGPYAVLNPFRIWLMVVLIVGISIASYLTSRYIGTRAGSVVSGILGGLISSTATTVSYARQSKTAPDSSTLAALVIMVASTIVFVRVAFEVVVVAPGIFWQVCPQFGVMGLWMALIAAMAFKLTRQKQEAGPEPKDPSNLAAAVIFGGLYALVLLAVAAAKQHFGDGGLYLVAALSGLTDMDAITLSTAQLITADRLDVETGWRMMMIGALSNILFKAGVVATLGNPRLLRRIAVLFGGSLLGGMVLLWLWP